jgi:hypothetical protein
MMPRSSGEKINRSRSKNPADETEMVSTCLTRFNVQMDAGWTKVYRTDVIQEVID